MQQEKEEIVRTYTIETGDLRKKVGVLTEHIQRLESAPPPPPPPMAAMAPAAPAAFAADYADIDSLTMDGAWDHISFLDDFAPEPEVKVERGAGPPKREPALLSEPEKPAAQGLLLMLLLVGAFVASQGASPTLPPMSDDVQAASSALLADIFKEAGVPAAAAPAAGDAPAPRPSGSAWAPAPSGPALGGSDMHGVAPSPLGDLAHRLTHATDEQHKEQLFSLSAAQYNGLTNHDFLHTAPPPATSQGRRNLGETLAAMRLNRPHSAAEVYTRSLLWDQVPTEVVRNFAKMVSDCHAPTRDAADGAPVG